MALVDTFNTVTREYYEPDLVDNIFDATPLWSLFYPHAQYKGGKVIRPTLKSGKLGGGHYGRTTHLTLTTPEVATHAQFPWSHYYVPVQLEAIDIDINAGAGPEQVVDLLDTYINAGGETMRDSHLGTDIYKYAGDPADDADQAMNGFYQMCQDSDWEADQPAYEAAGYGDILVADMPTWKAHVTRATGSAEAWIPVDCTVEVFRTLMDEMVQGDNASGELPDVVVTTPTVWTALSREIFNRGVRSVITMVGERLVKAGFNVIEIDNVPIIADNHVWPVAAWSEAGDAETVAQNLVTGHTAYFLNFNYCWPNVSRKYNLVFDEWLKETDYHRFTNKLFWWGQLICNQRRAQGAIYNIDTSVLYDS